MKQEGPDEPDDWANAPELLQYTAPKSQPERAKEFASRPSWAILAGMLSRPGLANRCVRMEFAGAFGELGTLVPFVATYFALLKMDLCGMLFASGTAM